METILLRLTRDEVRDLARAIKAAVYGQTFTPSEEKRWEELAQELTEMSKRAADDLLVDIVQEIVTWRDGIEFKAHYDNDGDGYRDFAGLEVMSEGVKALGRVIDKAFDR